MTIANDFRLVDQTLLRSMLKEPAQAAAACIVLKDTAANLAWRMERKAFTTKAEIRRCRVAAATALAAVRALKIRDTDVLQAADVLVQFLRNELPVTRSTAVAA